jgi:hypothetical protein
VRCVKIRDPQRADQPLIPQPVHLVQRIEPSRMLEGPPMELKQVHPLCAQPVESLLHPAAHNFSRHRPRLRAPLRHHHRSAAASRTARQKPAGDHFRAAVMVGHVEGIEACLSVGLQCIGCGIEREGALVPFDVRDLPEAADQPTDVAEFSTVFSAIQ